MIRRIIAQRGNRINRLTLFIRLPDGSIRALEPTFFEDQKAMRGCDQVFLFEHIETAMSRVTEQVLGSTPDPKELRLIKEHLLKQSSATTRKIYLVVYTPTDPHFEPSEQLKKFLIDPEDPPAYYTVPTHRRLLQEFAAEVRGHYASMESEISAAVNAA